MAFNINNIRQNIIGDGARPSLFEVTLTNPISSTGDAKLRFMVRAAQIPASNITPIEVPYFGRRIKLAGSRTYEDWNVTVMNDEDFAVRRAMESWSSAINSAEQNLRHATNYRSVAEVTQFAKTGEAIRRYQFINLFPTIISPIELSWENGDAVEEFSVTFAYDYWTVDDSEIIQ